jgi:hypothetical protein
MNNEPPTIARALATFAILMAAVIMFLLVVISLTGVHP